MADIQQVDIRPILTQWGAWGVVLVAIGFFVWKWVLPRIDKHLEAKASERALDRDNARKRDDKFVQMISENLNEAQKGREVERDKFLQLVDGTLKQQTAVLARLVDKIESQ
jgi:hypothetical protein